MKFENLLNKSYNKEQYENLKNDLNKDVTVIKEKQYTYVSVIYDDDIAAKTIGEPSFYYKTDLFIKVGDKVLVDRNGKKVVGEVVALEYYEEDKVPYPLNKTKDIIKIFEKTEPKIKESNEEFYIDPCDDNYMLIIHDLNNIKDEVNFDRSYEAKKDDFNIEELIKKCIIIFVIGNIDISEYDLSNKYVFNINNENNYGYYTAITYLSNQQSIINLIRAIYYSFFNGGFITIDLNDIAIGINGRIQYKRYSKNDIEQIFKDFDVNGNKKMFIIFEEPDNSNSDLFELNDIIDTLRDSYEKCDIYFAVPGISEAKELFINVFYGD